jgi:hypothetical protein
MQRIEFKSIWIVECVMWEYAKLNSYTLLNYTLTMLFNFFGCPNVDLYIWKFGIISTLGFSRPLSYGIKSSLEVIDISQPHS